MQTIQITDKQKQILIQLTSMAMHNLFSSGSKNFKEMRELGNLYITITGKPYRYAQGFIDEMKGR